MAAVVSGAPSTVHALWAGRDPLEATLAAGSIVLPDEQRRGRLIASAGLTHGAISLFWGLVLARVLPRSHTTSCGAAAGLAIAAIDLGLIGRRFPRLRALPAAPQVADHLVFGAVVGAVVARRRRERLSTSLPAAEYLHGCLAPGRGPTLEA